MKYVNEEFMETSRRVFAPAKACPAAVKIAITKCANMLGISTTRARDLMRGKTAPKVQEMDIVRSLDGRWCIEERKVKTNIMERIHDMVERLHDRYVTARERKREARKSTTERLFDRA